MRRPPLLAASWPLCLALPLAAQQPPPPSGSGDPPAREFPARAHQRAGGARAATDDGQDPPARVARIAYVLGDVSFQPSGDTTWSLATVNYPVTSGDRLYAERGGRGELQVGSLAVRIADATDLVMTNLTGQLVQLGLAQGTVRVTIYKLAPGDSVELDTPRGALTLLAPGAYRVDAPAGGDAMVVIVEHGSLQWTAGGVAQTVQEGQAIQVSGINPIQVTSLTPSGGDDFDRWAEGRDHRASASKSAQYVSRDIPGYDDLDDFGYWEADAQYGPLWYPTAVPAGWVPYRYGHWVWIEPWGWTWVEYERWGYAPFHYGRWVYVRSRWGWLPGPVLVRPYYAPALVVFVGGGAFAAGVQAWFPLGPGEPYYPWYHHDDEYRVQINVTNIRTVEHETWIRDVTYINRIEYRNRGVATTAVPTPVFQSGQPIGRRAIPVDRGAILRAPIVPHPVVLPEPSAARGGSPAPAAPPRRRPDFVTARPPQLAPPVTSGQPLVVPRTVPVPAPGTAPPLITRRPPPPQDPPFQQRRQAMQPDAGRPLEPQQIENLRAGKPAGPRRDPEYPPHPAPAVREAPRGRPAPAAEEKGRRRGERP